MPKQKTAPIKKTAHESRQVVAGVNSRTAVHILLRVRSENGQTIDDHAAIVRERGSAVLGKMGQMVGPDFRAALNG